MIIGVPSSLKDIGISIHETIFGRWSNEVGKGLFIKRFFGMRLELFLIGPNKAHPFNPCSLPVAAQKTSHLKNTARLQVNWSTTFVTFGAFQQRERSMST